MSGVEGATPPPPGHDMDRKATERVGRNSSHEVQDATLLEATSRPSGLFRSAMRGAIRTVIMLGALVLAIWVSYRVSEWWFALLLIGVIFAVSAMLAVRRQ